MVRYYVQKVYSKQGESRIFLGWAVMDVETGKIATVGNKLTGEIVHEIYDSKKAAQAEADYRNARESELSSQIREP